MKITESDVEKLAQLAMLDFSKEEKTRLESDLNDIVLYFEKLKELDTTDVKPTSHVNDITNVLREDETETWLSQVEALRNAPAQKMGFFSVPKVISHD